MSTINRVESANIIINNAELVQKRQHVLECARRYFGYIHHMKVGFTYIAQQSFSPSDNVIDDFRVLYSEYKPTPLWLIHQGRPVIFKDYQIEVRARHAAICSGAKPVVEKKLHLNCWEFCFLAFVDAELFTREQMAKLCFFCSRQFLKDNENGMEFAFKSHTATLLMKMDPKNVKAGDLILLKDAKDEVSHAMIATGELCKNKAYRVIENVHYRDRETDENDVREGRYFRHKCCDDELLSRTYHLPLEEAVKNVQDYIAEREQNLEKSRTSLQRRQRNGPPQTIPL